MKAKIMVLAVAAAFADLAGAQTTLPANTVPTGGVLRAGTGSVAPAAIAGDGKNTVVVTQTSQRGVFDWTSVDVGSNGAFRHTQSFGTQAITAHRVPGATSASVIEGAVSAPGTVMILNSHGVMFGATATVNVAGLIASTGSIDETQFMAGGAFAISGAAAGSVTNAGNITVTDAGLAAFVAPSVANSGIITATGGRIVLASADVSTVSFNGGLYELALTTGTNVAASITNTGTLSAAGGTIHIAARDAANVVSGVINLGGLQQASRIEVHGNEVFLATDLDAATVTGSSRDITLCQCGQIQDAIDIAASGAVIGIDAGTYTQSSTLNVNKSVTISGAGEANTLIDAHSVSGYGMLVTADNVSLSNFTLYGPAANVGTSYGIKVQPAGSAASSRLNDFSISHVTSRGAGRAELDLNGVVGATIDHFTAQGDNTAGAGIQITDSTNVTISNSTTTGNNWGGIALFQANRFFDQQVSNVTVQNNNSFAEAIPLYMQDESASRNFGAVSLPGFNYAVRNSANDQYTFFHGSLGGALNLATGQPTPAESYVQSWNGSATTQNFHVGSGMKIMKAVNQALPGAVVNVGAGLYAEQLTVTKNLTLAGAGASLVTVKPASLTADASGARSILTIGGGASVEVSGFTLRGPVPEINAGIFVRDGANANIHHNSIIDARESVALSGVQRGIGIFVGRAIFGTSGTATIANNTITGYQKGGIVVDGPGSQATITGNTVIGEGPTSVTAQNGIQVSRGASATVGGNTVSGNNYTPASDEATGILIFTPGFYLGQGSISVGPNNVGGNEVGVWTNDPATLASISLSGVTGNLRDGVADFGGGFAGSGQFLEYPAWSASSTALVNAGAFTGTQPGDLLSRDGALRVSGWSGFAAIQPAVNAVANGGTVNVAAGTYAEDVMVNSLRNLLFSGATLQSLTVNAAGSGIGGSVTANGGGFRFNAPLVLLGDTSLATTGANLTFNADVQTAGGMPFALSLSAGTGNVSMLSGGSSSNPLGFLDVDANNFSLAGTLWVSGYDIDALGDVALSTSTLRSLGTSNAITAGGDVTGSTIAQGPVAVQSGGQVTMNIETPAPLTISSVGPVNITGSAPEVVVSAPGGSITGNFSSVAATGGIIEVNGIPEVPQNLAGSFDVNKILPTDSQFAGNVLPAAPEEENVYFSTSEAERRGVRIVRGSPGSAGEALDRGLGVEIDLTPGYR